MYPRMCPLLLFVLAPVHGAQYTEFRDILWTGGQCPTIKFQWGNVQGCKDACEKTESCTVFNMSPKRNYCYLHSCPIPVLKPQYKSGWMKGWVGYTNSEILTDSLKDDGLVKMIAKYLDEDEHPTKNDFIATFENSKISKVGGFAESVLEEFCLSKSFNETLLPMFLKIVENPELEQLFPEFASYFQSYILPYAIQNAPADSPLFKATLKTKFPPPVISEATTKNKKVMIKNPYVESFPKCRESLYIKWQSNQWLSTGLYAKQGQVVTIKVPDHLVGKISFYVGPQHKDLLKWNLNLLKENKENEVKREAQVTQAYKKFMVSKETKILTPYGGIIYVVVKKFNKIGDIELEFQNVIESPIFIQGLTTNEEWKVLYEQSSAPLVEMEVPGLIFTIPRSNLDSLNPNMEKLAEEWKTIMEAIVDFESYDQTIPIRYMTDVSLGGAGGLAAYPLMGTYLPNSVFDLKAIRRTGDYMVNTVYHEIGHLLQDYRWPSSIHGQVGSNLMKYYVSEKLYNSSYKAPLYPKAIKQFRADRKLRFVTRERIYLMVKDRCGWDTYKNGLFKFYQEELPVQLTPNTEENKIGTMVKILSKTCNVNLAPFFNWWGITVPGDAMQETEKLPEWTGIIEYLDTADPATYEGRCMVDSRNRLLPKLMYGYDRKSTPKLCIESCAASNFMWAGVQNGVECWCGNIEPSASKSAPTKECHRGCPGDGRFKCGGGWRMNVFNTDEPWETLLQG